MKTFGTKAVLVIGATAALAWSVSFIAMPLIQAREEGIDWFTSLCRAAGFSAAPGGQPARQMGSVSLVTWSPSVLERLAKANITKGEEIAADVCAACHNPNGMSADAATMPSLAGQPARALYKQLWDMKNGTRVNEAMKPLMENLKDDEIADVALYYSERKPRNQDFRLERENSKATLRLVTQGDSARALPACQSCHDTAGGGPIDAPNLVGQYPRYMSNQLHAFADGIRRNDMFARMRTIAAKLTPQETDALANYYDGPR